MSGYSGTPLIKKLGIKEGHKILILNAPKNYFEMLGELPNGVIKVGPNEEEIDFVHLFTNSFEELENAIGTYKSRIVKNGMIWVSWYKKASKLPTELNEDIIRGTALNLGLVDVKVCAVDDNWSGLKIVIRVKDR